MFARAIGWAFVVLALVVLAWTGWLWLETDGFPGMAAGELWYRLAPEAPNTVQAVIQRRLYPALWDDVVLPLLLWPAPLVLIAFAALMAAVGLLLSLAFRGRRRPDANG